MAEKTAVYAKTPEPKQKCSLLCKQDSGINNSGFPADRILHLQRTAGNQAVQRLIRSGVLQAKLKTGQPNDMYEQEADRVAEQVMRMPEPQVQCNCAKLDDNEKKVLQAKMSAGQVPVTVGQDVPSIVHEVLRSPGQPLDPITRAFMELRFGYDFSQVQVHTDAQAAESARAVNARAYTVGRDVVFGPGEFRPDSTEGTSLLAHEFVHVAQQNGARVGVLLPGNRSEKAVFAHELTLMVQHEATNSAPKREKPFNKSSVVPEKAAEFEKASAPQAEKKESFPAVDESVSEESFAGSALSKGILRAPATPEQDPDFQKAKRQVRTEAKRQKKHASAFRKREEVEKASALKEADQIEQSSKEKSTEEMERVGAKQQKVGEKFDARTFQKDLRNRIQGKGPKTESQAREFAKKPPIKHFEEDFSKNVAAEQGKVTGPLEQKASAKPTGGVPEKTPVELPKPAHSPAPKPVDPKLAIPKPRTKQEISLQHESDRLEDAMQKNRISEEQLAESREPSFLETLRIKQEAQKKAAEAPGVYRQKEAEILQAAEVQTSKSLSTELEGMGKLHQQIGGKIFSGQKKTESKSEKRQREIKEKIDGIYKGTVEAVKGILERMVSKVKEDFANSLRKQTDTFNKNVNNRLNNYYTTGKKVKHFFLGEPKVVVDEKTDTTRPLTRGDWDLSSFPPRIKAGVEWINPEVYEIFLEEKNNFLNEMDSQISSIAEDVTTGLTAAQNQIQLGKTAISFYKATLKGNEWKFADQLEKEVDMKFKNLEGSIDDTREDLLQTLADQYTENVSQLETKFNEINDELKKSWIDRSIEFIETVGKTIFQLAELLLSILTRVAHLIWDIVKHPIRFFETLVSGLKQGIGKFIDNISTYLQEAFWTWVTGATPVKNIRLSASSGIESLFDLVMQVLNLGPSELRAIVERKLGKEFMQMVDKGIAFGEKAIEPVTILLSKGPGAFWQYIKDTVGSIIQSSFDRIKESVFNAFVEKGLKWIAGFFVPGGGFVKIVKAIFHAFQFVAENLANIRHFFDSIFDSMEAAIEGRIEGVASRIITGLKTGVVLALDFLAKQLGLSKIVDSVQKIIQSLRRPIVNAIEWILGKAKPFVMKIMKKGKELLEEAKEGAAKIKKGVKAFLEWWKIKIKFKDPEGESHTLYFKGKEKGSPLMVRTTSMTIESYLSSLSGEVNPEKIEQAKIIAGELKVITRRDVDQNERRVITGKMTALSKLLMELGGISTKNLPKKALWTFLAIKGAKVELLSSKTSGGGTKPSGSPKGWNLLQAYGMTDNKGGHWKRMHLISAAVGGKGIAANLIPAPTAINSGIQVLSFESSIKNLVERDTRKHKPNVVWAHVYVNKYHPSSTTPVYDDMTFADNIKMLAGLHFFEKGLWKADPTERIKEDVKIPLPAFGAQKVISINMAGRVDIAGATGVTKHFAYEIVRLRPEAGFKSFSEMNLIMKKERNKKGITITPEFTRDMDQILDAEIKGKITFR